VIAVPRSGRDLTGPFWTAVERNELVRPVCGRCGHNFFSPQVVCPSCQSGEWTYEKSSGLGQVVSHTTIHRAPDPRFDPPYVVADVEVDEGWRLFTWIIGCPPDQVHIGQQVRVQFVAGVDGALVPAFAPRVNA
jgi:uncharacterized OB-fold protein